MTFYEKVKSLCEIRGVSITTLALELGFSKSTPTTWKNSEGLPRAATVKKVADYFGMSVRELKKDIDPPIDYDNLDTSSFNQPVWNHLLECHDYDVRKALRDYLAFEKAEKEDAVTDRALHAPEISIGTAKGNSLPDDDIKTAICRRFMGSLDYLLGISDEKEKLPDSTEELVEMIRQQNKTRGTAFFCGADGKVIDVPPEAEALILNLIETLDKNKK